MAVSCGLPLNDAMGSAVNMLGDVRGGAGQQTLELYYDIDRRTAAGVDLADATAAAIADRQATRTKFVPGFGHRFHKNGDPRARRRWSVSGRFVRIGLTVEAHLRASRDKLIPMNIDGATAVIFAELGCEPPLARGLFCLSRSVGFLAHA